MSSGEPKPIIFYDISSITPGRPWSPNTLKTRYCLGYKQLPFTTVWVELPDIAGLLQSKGITDPPYTLPAIEDPNTGAFIMDSVAIATYLDETYPETPKVLNPAARAALERFGDTLSFGSGRLGNAVQGAGQGAPASFPVAARSGDNGKRDGARDHLAPRLVFLILANERLNPVSKTYYHQTRGARIGEPWLTLASACAASPEDRAERVQQGIEAIGVVWRKIAMTLYGSGNSGSEEGTDLGLAGPDVGRTFAFGEEPCFLDFAVAGRVKFVLDTLTPSEATAVTSLDGGRLERLVEDLERYL